MCEIDTRPGPITIITRQDARSIRSSATPPWPVRWDAPFTTNIAPSIMIDKIDEEIRDKTPRIRRIPPIVSANAIGICNSAGNPIPVKKSAVPGLNFPVP